MGLTPAGRAVGAQWLHSRHTSLLGVPVVQQGVAVGPVHCSQLLQRCHVFRVQQTTSKRLQTPLLLLPLLLCRLQVRRSTVTVGLQAPGQEAGRKKHPPCRRCLLLGQM